MKPKHNLQIEGVHVHHMVSEMDFCHFVLPVYIDYAASARFNGSNSLNEYMR